MRAWLHQLHVACLQVCREHHNIRARWIDLLLGAPILFILGLRRKSALPQIVTSLCLLFQESVGDTLLVGSTIAAFRQRYPDAKITFASARSNLDALRLLPEPNQIIIIDNGKFFDAIKTLRHARFDLLIDFTPWTRRGPLLAALSGAKWTAGFKTSGQYRHFAYDKAVLHKSDCHEIDNVRALALAADVVSQKNPTARMMPLPEGYLNIAAPFVVFHPWPAAANARLREWPIERWVELSRIVIKSGYNIIITGGPADKISSMELIVRMNGGNNIQNAAGGLNLRQTATLLSQAACVISVNTGVMHLAAAIDAPMVALHGPTSVVRWGPLSDRAINIASPHPSAGYLDLGFEIDWKNIDYMNSITVDMVHEAFTSLSS